MVRPGCIQNAFLKARYCLAAVSLLGLAIADPVGAFNYVADANGTWWGIQDAAPPRVDTGSIRATQVGPGQHVDQRLRRHQGSGANDAGATLQRRDHARLWSHV